MRYAVEMPLSEFDFWGPAKQHAEKLTIAELDKIEDELALLDFFNEDPTDTQINDLFAYDFDYVCELVGLNPEEVIKRD